MSAVLVLALPLNLVLSTVSEAPKINPEKYINVLNKAEKAYKDIINDLCGMMEIAERFRDDPSYVYDESHMKSIIMRDGVNGMQEMLTVFNDLVNMARSDMENLTSAMNITGISFPEP
ncbi:MAG: hypothetical protein NZ952_06755 [Candidatus Bathyarchaeota archaeon]|nr:hypothetical protein [Candidatus Bathyarchaeota archaeon]